jgi:molecular chaperone GrpE
MAKDTTDIKEELQDDSAKDAKNVQSEASNKSNDEAKQKAEDSKNTSEKENSNGEASDAKDTSSEEKPKLTKEEELEIKLKEQKEKYLRLFAEFENFRKRTGKERIELFKTASQEVMQAMLPVLDDFDRAMKEISKSEDKALTEGVDLIHNKLRETLKSKGLEVMNVKSGDAFDADLHEAVTQIPAPDKELKGKIIDVLEKGYTLGEKIIRFPKVVTGK